MVRLKTRYIIVEIIGTRLHGISIQKDHLLTILKQSIALNYGDYGIGLSQYAFQFLYYNYQTHLAVIRCLREHCKIIETSLSFITTTLQHQDIKLRTVRICGSRRTCCQYLQALSMEKINLSDQFDQIDMNQFQARLQYEISTIDPQ